MANVQGKFYTSETQRRGVTPSSPPNAEDDPQDPLNPPGSTPAHAPVTIGIPANGLSILGQVLSIGLSSTSTIGALSDTDWNTFNSKIGEAPNDGQQYARQSLGWSVVSGGGGGLPPIDGSYASQALMIADQANQTAQYIYFDGNEYWEYLGTTTPSIADYRAISTSIGGSFISYAVAQGLTNTQKQQARDNAGLDTGIPQVVATIGTINNLSKTSNFIKFTGAGAISITGILEDSDGNELTIQNNTGNNITFLPNDGASLANNRFDFSFILPNGEIKTLRYDGTTSKWTLKYESWSPVGSGIYRNSQVSIGRNTLGGSNASLAINSLGSTAGFPIILGHDVVGTQVFNISKEGWFGSGVNPTTNFSASKNSTGNQVTILLAQTNAAGCSSISLVNSASKNAWISLTSPSYAASLGNFFYISLLTTGTDIVIAPNMASTGSTTEKIWMRCGGFTTAFDTAYFDINGLTFINAKNIILGTTTGTKIGTATTQKLSFWNKTPIIQPTNAITASAFVANTSGIANDTATYGGYTMGQIAAALINTGILA